MVIAALATLWVDRSLATRPACDLRQGARALRRTLREAIDARIVLCAPQDCPIIDPARFRRCRPELTTLEASTRAVEDFGAMARKHSEESITRERTAASARNARRRAPAVEVREALFTAKAAGAGFDDAGDRCAFRGGCLLWPASRARHRAGEMSAHVHRGLRKRFLESVVTRESVRTYLEE